MQPTHPPASSLTPNSHVYMAVYGFLFLMALLTYTAFHEHSIFLDCDSPWHIAAGEWMLQHGTIPYSDPWSFASGGMRWYNLSWLYDIGAGALHSSLGLQGLVAVNLLLAALIPCFIARVCFMRSSNIVAVLAASVLALIFIKACISIRPQQPTLILFCLSLMCLYAYRSYGSRHIWWLPLIALFWANVHGSYPSIVVLTGCFFLESASRRNVRECLTLMAVSVACILATLFNPYGVMIYYGTWLSLGSHYAQMYISEWQTATLSNAPQVYLLAALLCVLLLVSRKKAPLADVLLAFFWAAMSVLSMRHSVIFAVVSAPLLAFYAGDVFSRSARLSRLNAALLRDFSVPKNARQFAGIGLVLMAVYIAPAGHTRIISDSLYDPASYPVKEIDYLSQHFPGQRVFNTYCYGGFLIYQTRGGIQPFMDSRIVTAYPQTAERDYFTALYFQPGWQAILDDYSLKLALFPLDDTTAESELLKAGWSPVFSGDVAAVYQRESSPTPAVK